MALLRAYGAEVVVCPTAVDPEHPDSYYSVARRLTETTPGAFMPNQYANPHNPEAHERTTGPEIWAPDRRAHHPPGGQHRHGRDDLGHRAAISRPRTPTIQIIGADPEGSVYSGGQGRPYLVEGIGEDFWPATYDRDDRRPGGDGVRPRQLPDRPAGDPGGGHPGRRVVRHGGVGRRSRWAATSAPTP